jgi:toxin ParE1/3/4
MSSPKVPLKLSPAARQDLIDILRYTGEQWGQDQLLVYRGKLDDALLLLMQNSGLGHRSPELPEETRLYFVGSHVIVYRIRPNATEVIRILHRRMCITKHL